MATADQRPDRTVRPTSCRPPTPLSSRIQCLAHVYQHQSQGACESDLCCGAEHRPSSNLASSVGNRAPAPPVAHFASSGIYVHVPSLRSAHPATYADRQKGTNTLAPTQLSPLVSWGWHAVLRGSI